MGRLQGGWGSGGAIRSVPVDPDEAVPEHGLGALHGPLGLMGVGELDQRPLWITLVRHLVSEDGHWIPVSQHNGSSNSKKKIRACLLRHS